MDRVDALLSGGARLITLTGPGGIGKTRLAAEAAGRVHRRDHVPVFWAALAELVAGTGIEDAVRSAASIDPAAGHRLESGVPSVTGGDPEDHRILVLDNCEHILSEVGATITALLEAVPGLTVLATSREAIGWVDEYLVAVPPLSVTHSVQLFQQRMQLTGRPAADADQLEVIEEICRRVDHNPLFIRLAAARLRYQPPAMVLRELSGDDDDQRLRWSHGPRLGVEARHRGVYDVVAWSFDLCSPWEQLLLERLSTFAAGYVTDDEQTLRNGITAEAAIAVCADETLPAAEVQALLERLAECSLLSTHLNSDVAQWYLVESVRVFARDRLSRRDPADATRTAARHRRFWRDRIVAGQFIWDRPQDQTWLDRSQSGWDDIFAAVESALADPIEAVVGLEIATALLWMWVPFVTVDGPALTRLTEHALTATAPADLASLDLRLGAMAVLGWIALWEGRSREAGRLLDEAAAACGPLPPDWRDIPEQDVGLPAPVEWMWGTELMLTRRDTRAILVLARARDKFTASGDRTGAEVSAMLVAIASAFTAAGAQALEVTASYLERSRSSGSDLTRAWAMLARAVALAKNGCAREAIDLTGEVLEHHLIDGDMWTASLAVGARIAATTAQLAGYLGDGGDGGPEAVRVATRVAQLVGALRTCHRVMGVAIDQLPLLSVEIELAAQVSAMVLGAPAYAAAENQGARLRPEFEQLRQYGLQAQPADEAFEPEEPTRWTVLSRAERDVAVLAAAGWSNSAIAARRRSSVRTVDAQVATIRQKLMINSRTEIIGYVPPDLAERMRLEAQRRPRRGSRRAGTG
ncbi:ATP-binding protein [Nocardia sp. alder85J]|uniref:ATP-binding protein n=1 Tax=Nocardia sp. alder85J TaxID=2862949 RepID=UPI001CD37FD5|nr:LuxR C-terminal-related transcriptional regulator [Nocardia sp. alder85J]MCX4092216.1 LuxR C-terminal-related transcriptional regulator [Nocardia sp. alder85J]